MTDMAMTILIWILRWLVLGGVIANMMTITVDSTIVLPKLVRAQMTLWMMIVSPPFLLISLLRG